MITAENLKGAIFMCDRYLNETAMLDYSHPAIQRLIREKGWPDMSEFDRLKAIYNYVRDEILFGYNVDDDIPASKVLKDGYGQCKPFDPTAPKSIVSKHV